MNFSSEAMGYSNSKKVLGLIAEVNFRNLTITLEDADDVSHVVDIDDVKVLEVVGYIGEEIVYDHDVIHTTDDKKYEVEIQEDAVNIKLHLLDENLGRVESGEKFLARNIALLVNRAEVVGSIFDLLNAPPPEKKEAFNIKIVRETLDGNTTYFYACNNLETNEVDLIKVVFIGHHLLEEEQYERRTLSHQVYLDSLEAKTLKEVNSQELMNYVTGATYNDEKKNTNVAKGHDEEDEDCECDDCRCDCEACRAYREDGFCNDCGKECDDCDCEW